MPVQPYLSPGGRLRYADLTRTVPGIHYKLAVDYSTREYTRWSWHYDGASGKAPGHRGNVCNGAAYDDGASLVAYLQGSLACGGLRKDGYAQIGGVRAVRLVVTRKYRTRPGDIGPSADESVFYLSAATFLPIQIDGPEGPPGNSRSVDNLTWLAPTPANLNLLKLPVPAGFRRNKKAAY